MSQPHSNVWVNGRCINCGWVQVSIIGSPSAAWARAFSRLVSPREVESRRRSEIPLPSSTGDAGDETLWITTWLKIVGLDAGGSQSASGEP